MKWKLDNYFGVKFYNSVYGRLKNVRLPKKLHENKERHRGFCFVEFLSRQEAEVARF